MPGVEFIDRTGLPETDEALQEALVAIETALVQDMLKMMKAFPKLAVQLTTIHRALKELLGIKRIIREHKEKQNNGLPNP